MEEETGRETSEATSEPRKAVSYRRVSTARQAKEGRSLASQQEMIENLCKASSLEIIREFEDQGSAKRNKPRPGLEEAVRLVCEHRGTLVVYSLSRFARSTLDACRILEGLKECGADLVIVNMHINTATPHGKLLFNIFASVAEFESELIGERVKAANSHTQRRLGYRTQGIQPAGWQIVNGVRVPVAEEKRIIQRVILVAEGKTYREAAKELNSLGVKTIKMARGKTDRTIPNWSGATVHNIIVANR